MQKLFDRFLSLKAWLIFLVNAIVLSVCFIGSPLIMIILLRIYVFLQVLLISLSLKSKLPKSRQFSLVSLIPNMIRKGFCACFQPSFSLWTSVKNALVFIVISTVLLNSLVHALIPSPFFINNLVHGIFVLMLSYYLLVGAIAFWRLRLPHPPTFSDYVGTWVFLHLYSLIGVWMYQSEFNKIVKDLDAYMEITAKLYSTQSSES